MDSNCVILLEFRKTLKRKNMNVSAIHFVLIINVLGYP